MEIIPPKMLKVKSNVKRRPQRNKPNREIAVNIFCPSCMEKAKKAFKNSEQHTCPNCDKPHVLTIPGATSGYVIKTMKRLDIDDFEVIHEVR